MNNIFDNIPESLAKTQERSVLTAIADKFVENNEIADYKYCDVNNCIVFRSGVRAIKRASRIVYKTYQLELSMESDGVITWHMTKYINNTIQRIKNISIYNLINIDTTYYNSIGTFRRLSTHFKILTRKDREFI